MKISIFLKLLLLILVVNTTSCATLMGEKAKDDALKTANKKAKSMGLKVGSACKYIGFIGDSSEKKAMSNGGMKNKLFSVKDVGGVFKKCTYVYGKDKLF